MAHQLVEELVREYLIFRGFANTLKTFDTDLKYDKNKNFRQDRILEEIILSIHNSQFESLREIWAHLQNHLFSKLEYTYNEAVKKLENGLYKFYLVTAYQSNRTDKITEFFTKMAPELHNNSEWREWFFFPFATNPSENPTFAVCFTKIWQDTLMLSLHNFLATIMICLPQATLCNNEGGLIKKLQEENTKMRQRIQSLCQGQQPTTSSSTHQSRISTFYDKKFSQSVSSNRLMGSVTSPNDIIPFDIPPPNHLVDDFYIIAQETLNVSSISESQAKGFRSLIRNIGSPVLGSKESHSVANTSAPSGSDKKQPKRSGSVGSNRTYF